MTQCDICGEEGIELPNGGKICPACRDTLKGCEHCGEIGGYPVEVESREYQGDPPHGGVVTWVDRMCSLCVPRHSHD